MTAHATLLSTLLLTLACGEPLSTTNFETGDLDASLDMGDAGHDARADLRAEPVDLSMADDALDATIDQSTQADLAIDLGPDLRDAPHACLDAQPACPSHQSVREGGGLVPIDVCAFPIDRGQAWDDLPAKAQALSARMPAASLADVLDDLNRSPTVHDSAPGSPIGFEYALRWEDSENNKKTWYPQGITGSADATAQGLVNGRHLIVVSFYFKVEEASAGAEDKGVRVAIIDVTDRQNPRYRFALLVEPTGSTQAPDFKPVTVHAGGMAWVGDYLYVADTFRGMRVFDMKQIYRADIDDTIGCDETRCTAGLYKYVIPQIGAYRHDSDCSPRFSFLSLSRQSTPPMLVTGEYCSNSSCDARLSGRVFGWPIDLDTGRLTESRAWPHMAYYAGHGQLQGAAFYDGLVYQSSSAPPAGAGELYSVREGATTTSAWIDSPEDLLIDAPHGLIWSLSEAPGERFVFASRLSALPSP